MSWMGDRLAQLIVEGQKALGKEVVIDLGAECEWLSNSDEMTHGGPISRIIVSYLHEKSHLVM